MHKYPISISTERLNQLNSRLTKSPHAARYNVHIDYHLKNSGILSPKIILEKYNYPCQVENLNQYKHFLS
jgi:hypothetical protein